MNFQEIMQTDTIATAKALLGMELILSGLPLGIIVETEAYLFPDDAASHSFGGRHTARNHSMYLSAGHWYVYQIYGHQMLNLVTREENQAEAVLIRALELPTGQLLANGPGKLTRYCEIDKRFDGQDLSELSLAPKYEPLEIRQRPRIGIRCPDYGKAWQSAPLGFYVTNNRAVSKISVKNIQKQSWKIEKA